VAAVIYHTLQGLKLAYPTVDENQKQALEAARQQLENENGGKPDKAVEKYETAYFSVSMCPSVADTHNLVTPVHFANRFILTRGSPKLSSNSPQIHTDGHR
jgi:hypothetical protein